MYQFIIRKNSHCLHDLENIHERYRNIVYGNKVPRITPADTHTVRTAIQHVLVSPSRPHSCTKLKVKIFVQHQGIAKGQASSDSLTRIKSMTPKACFTILRILSSGTDPPAREHIPRPVAKAGISGCLIIIQGDSQAARLEFPWIILCAGQQGEMLMDTKACLKIDCSHVCPINHIGAYGDTLRLDSGGHHRQQNN